MKYKFFFLILGICIITIPNALATSITLTPNTGPLGTSVNVKGLGFTSTSTSTHNYDTNQVTGWSDNVFAEKFTGLPVGNTINSLQLKINNTGLGNFTACTFSCGYLGPINSPAGTNWNSDVNVNRFTGLQSDSHVTFIQFNVTAAVGNIRLKIYDSTNASSNARPSSLLYESGSIAVTGTGIQTFPVSAYVGSSGVIWAGFETDNAGLGLIYQNITDPPSNACKSVAHVYGSGPNPFGTALAGNCLGAGKVVSSVLIETFTSTNVRIKVYQDDGASGGPSTLLGQSGSQRMLGTGLQTFPVSATVPASGNAWVGFEVNNTHTVLRYAIFTDPPNNTCDNVAHVFGSGPSPFGAISKCAGTSPYESINYGSTIITLKFDSTTLTTSPTPITANTTGGFSGVVFTNPSNVLGLHVVNASDSSFHATANFNVTSGFAYNVLQLTGYVLSNNGIFPNPNIYVTSSYNVTQLGLYDVALLQSHTFSPAINITANTITPIPHNFTDTGRSGSVTYTEIAILQNKTATIALQSNPVTLVYGNVVLGQVNVNQTNPNFVPIWFHRSDFGTNTRLDVIFPNTANMTCNLNYQFAQTNKTYFNIPFIVYDATQDNSSFLFHNSTNDVVKVFCRDLKTTNTGSYLITQFNFPFIQQIKSFQAGTFGTTGQFGMLDIVSLSIIIISMIGFNRINESVGAFFSIAIMGACWFFGIMSFPGIVFGAMTLIIGLAILSTRKTGGF